MKRLLRGIANAADLSKREQELLAAWVQATQSHRANDYAKAHEALRVALEGGLERLVLVAPLKTWGQPIINVLLLKPVHSKFLEIKSTWGDKLPALPSHFPVEIVAGVGPYSSGGHMVLFTSSIALNGATENNPIGLEFINVWRARLAVALPWLANLSDSALSSRLQSLAADKECLDRAVLSSILCHEAGHVEGPLPIFGSEDKVSALRMKWAEYAPNEEAIDVTIAMLSDLSADVAFVGLLSLDSLAVVVAYHLMNLLHCWNNEPYEPANWKPMRTDPDGLGGAIVAEALMKHRQNGFITSSTINATFGDLRHVVNGITAAIANGQLGKVLELTKNSLSSEVQRLLTMPIADATPLFADSLCKKIDMKPFRDLAEALSV